MIEELLQEISQDIYFSEVIKRNIPLVIIGFIPEQLIKDTSNKLLKDTSNKLLKDISQKYKNKYNKKSQENIVGRVRIKAPLYFHLFIF